MTRRALLGILGAAVLDPERLVWKPGKFISIPGARVEPCPYLVVSPFTSIFDPEFVRRDVRAQADVLNALLRDRWQTDPEFRRLAAFDTINAFVLEQRARHFFGLMRCQIASW